MIWHGIIELKPLPGCTEIRPDVLGGYVNVLAEADSEEEFIGICEDEFLEMKLKVVGAENITYCKSIEAFSFSDEVLIENIRNNFESQNFTFGKFNWFMAEGEA